MPAWRRPHLVAGIYDEPVTQRLADALSALGARAHTRPSPTIDVVAPALEALLGEGIALALTAATAQTHQPHALVHELLQVLHRHAPKAFPRQDELRLTDQWLDSVTDGAAPPPDRPLGSLHAPKLLVNADGEALLDHLRSEFDSADRVDLLCAFIKLSGFEKIRPAIERHCSARGRPLRVLTTTYMGASDAAAIERLALLPNVEVKVSYDADSTRLHAKAWIFHRDSGYSTAYVGSSNLSYAAQTDGLEWNVRVTEQGQPQLVAQMGETFAQYWFDPYQFEVFDPANLIHRTRLVRALTADPRRFASSDYHFDLEPKDFQRRILDELQDTRALGRHRNLLVAATGTGKTVMAALDYRNLRAAGTVETLLFVAHRREILSQARETFRHALHIGSFGELLCDGEQPVVGRHVFASIASLAEMGAARTAGLDPASFDMVIIDEAHHSPAASWEALLQHLAPTELLGMTGTPERADGLDHEQHFPRPWVGNLRVWNAIPHALVPFRYYMLDVEGVDLRDVAWVAGGYATAELSHKLVGAAEIFVQRAVRALAEHIASRESVRAIAFCADVAHAEEVCRQLKKQNLRAEVLTGKTESQTRRDARDELNSGKIQILCVVDIYNEGVDVPNVNTLFFFRPTESATVFLQQLGRGLRRAPDKAELVVFDLTGRQHHQFRFDRKLRAALGHTPREVREFVQTGFGRLPAGCHLHFDERARQDVLAQIRRSIPSQWKEIAQLLREPAHAALTLDQFLHETDIALDDIYATHRSWTLLRQAAGLDRRPIAADELEPLKNVHKLTHVGDGLRLDLWQRLVDGSDPRTESERRLANMLFAVLYGKHAAADGTAAALWRQHRVLHAELQALIPVLRRLNANLSPPHRLDLAVPLVLHARYLGAELSAAFDDRATGGDFRDYYTGVEPVCNGRYDLLLVTLQKSAQTKDHLKYRDFPLSAHRFHWQSKAATTLQSREGKRHVAPDREGVTPLLLVRERNKDAGQTVAFRYLGPVKPVRCEGERPISVEWQLAFAMPAEVLAEGRVAA